MAQQKHERTVIISDDKLEGDLAIPQGAQAIILFAHGSGSSRHSTRNQYVAKVLNDAGFATLLVDLLTAQEKMIDEESKHLRFDIDLLARRLLAVTQWLLQEPETSNLRIGYFGSSTGAAAALIAVAKPNDVVKAIVCRGGRPDLADSRGMLEHVSAPTLLIVGGNDTPVIALNKASLKQLSNAEAKELTIIPGAGHLFEELGKMEEVAKIATEFLY
jgi:putative phosphoribosyl transferase